jgi:nucleotide-binding universal stress UspA family protein
MPEAPVLLSYVGSENAKHAIREAGRLMAPAQALVVSVWQDSAAVPSVAWAGGVAVPTMGELLEAVRDSAEKVAAEGAQLAAAAGFDASAVIVEASGPIWKALVDVADEHDASAIVLGSRGLSGVKSLVLGSVSSNVLHHTQRPTLVVREPDTGDAG